MYSQPQMTKLDAATEDSSCCWVYAAGHRVDTGLCNGQEQFPTCNVPAAGSAICTIGVNTPLGPVIVSGHP